MPIWSLFLAGPGPFALLGAGPAVDAADLAGAGHPARHRASGDDSRQIKADDDVQALSRVTREFRFALLAVWLGTDRCWRRACCCGCRTCCSRTITRSSDVIQVTAITAAIMLASNFRAPLGTLLQAAGEFKALARISSITSVISILATLIAAADAGTDCVAGRHPAGRAGDLVSLPSVWWPQWRARHAGQASSSACPPTSAQ
jgi:hypothetical protein